MVVINAKNEAETSISFLQSTSSQERERLKSAIAACLCASLRRD